MVNKNRRVSIGLLLAVIVALVLTSTLAARPTRMSPAIPSSGAEVASGPAASDIALPELDVPIHRPRRAPEPSVLPTTNEASTPEPAPAIQLVAVAPLTVDVWNAEERYFSIVGSTPDEIVASANASVPADPTGVDRATMAYAGPIAWDHQPSYVQDSATGSCTMTAVASTVAYQATLPQWTASSDVPTELHAWWLVVLEHIREHESQHIRIFDEYVAALPARIVGQPCSAWDAIIAQWSAELLAAQSAFDAAEAGWELPAYAGALDW